MLFVVALFCLCLGVASAAQPSVMDHIADVNTIDVMNKQDLKEYDIKVADGEGMKLNITICHSLLYHHLTTVLQHQVNTRGGINGDSYRWPNAVVPYTFDWTMDEATKNVVHDAIDDYNRHTCIRWVPRSSESSYVRFIKSDGCWSYVGRIYSNYPQDLSLGSGCEYKMTAIHEMMHAAGFYHTQSRYDRDAYVDIYWENIMDGYAYAFDMYDSSFITNYNEYDLNSVMQYQTWAFSKNGLSTITAKNDPDATIYLGQPHVGGGFATSDIVKLNEMYNC